MLVDVSCSSSYVLLILLSVAVVLRFYVSSVAKLATERCVRLASCAKSASCLRERFVEAIVRGAVAD